MWGGVVTLVNFCTGFDWLTLHELVIFIVSRRVNLAWRWIVVQSFRFNLELFFGWLQAVVVNLGVKLVSYWDFSKQRIAIFLAWALSISFRLLFNLTIVFSGVLLRFFHLNHVFVLKFIIFVIPFRFPLFILSNYQFFWWYRINRFRLINHFLPVWPCLTFIMSLNK